MWTRLRIPGHLSHSCGFIFYDGFKKYVNNKNGKELEKTAEEDISLPDEMLIVE